MTGEVLATSAPPILLLLPSGRQTFDDDGVAGVVDVARRAEAAGFAGVCASDHVLLGDDLSGYPYGNFGHAPDAPFLEPLTVLAAVAAATTTLRLATHILLAPLRPAPLLAKTAVTLDRLSGGRLELGVGVGWHREEFIGLGIRFEERGERLDETMATCRALWSGGVEGLHCAPRPTRAGGPVVLFSGAPTARNVRRVVTMGDGWIAPGVTDAGEVAAGVARLRPAWEAAGREPDALIVRAALPVRRQGGSRVPDLAATLAEVDAFVEAGATDVVVPMGAFVRRPEDVAPWFVEAQKLILTSNNLPATVGGDRRWGRGSASASRRSSATSEEHPMAAVNSLPAPVTSAGVDDLAGYRADVAEWVKEFAPAFARARVPSTSFDDRALEMRALQRAAYEAGWLRYGWPTELGGLGGDARHRAVLYDELGRAGLALRGPAEHLEIMAAPLVHHWAGLDEATFTAFLRGDEWWCQGFSEPDAGSDLVSLRTHAIRDGDAYRLSGRKIWTSWAGHADRCLVLARTGTKEDRHRGLSAFFIDLDWPGIEVRRIRQANGSDELAEVTFDDVVVPADRLVGVEGGGFAIALDVLGCERSSFAWLRQAVLYARADELCARAEDVSDEQLGDLLVDLFALRSTAAEQVATLAGGRFPGPDAAVVKVLLTWAEQRLYDTAYSEFGSSFGLGSTLDMADWQEEYLFSRAVSIYGGTRQIQLTTVARFLLGLPNGDRS